MDGSPGGRINIANQDTHTQIQPTPDTFHSTICISGNLARYANMSFNGQSYYHEKNTTQYYTHLPKFCLCANIQNKTQNKSQGQQMTNAPRRKIAGLYSIPMLHPKIATFPSCLSCPACVPTLLYLASGSRTSQGSESGGGGPNSPMDLGMIKMFRGQ